MYYLWAKQRDCCMAWETSVWYTCFSEGNHLQTFYFALKLLVHPNLMTTNQFKTLNHIEKNLTVCLQWHTVHQLLLNVLPVSSWWSGTGETFPNPVCFYPLCLCWQLGGSGHMHKKQLQLRVTTGLKFFRIIQKNEPGSLLIGPRVIISICVIEMYRAFTRRLATKLAWIYIWVCMHLSSAHNVHVVKLTLQTKCVDSLFSVTNLHFYLP